MRQHLDYEQVQELTHEKLVWSCCLSSHQAKPPVSLCSELDVRYDRLAAEGQWAKQTESATPTAPRVPLRTRTAKAVLAPINPTSGHPAFLGRRQLAYQGLSRGIKQSTICIFALHIFTSSGKHRM